MPKSSTAQVIPFHLGWMISLYKKQESPTWQNQVGYLKALAEQRFQRGLESRLPAKIIRLQPRIKSGS